MRIAFYAPLKPPDHPVPSGDRSMARLLMRALAEAGHDVVLASRLRAGAGEESLAAQTAIRQAARRETRRLIEGWSAGAGRPPDLWFTYHLYYRAPDWIGPEVATRLGLPYVVAEASFAMKRAHGVWSIGHDQAARALARADIVFSLAAGDRPGLAKAPGFRARMVDLPPFIDPGPAPRPRPRRERPTLIAVAMMRARAKIESYRILARALAGLGDLAWRLVVVGDGPARGEVERALAPLGEGRVEFLGALAGSAVERAYARADLLVWPGFDEAYGMVYLEAQAAGLPVVAMDHGGVGNVVVDGVSGCLTVQGDEQAYARAVRALIEDPPARAALGRSARAFIERERSLGHAARVLGRAIATLVPAA
jgi:glycosyltransferase involved in cell wall biosynthesis